jgi:hypothetical protein
MAFLALLPVFAAAFGAGIVRGLRAARTSTVSSRHEVIVRPWEQRLGHHDPA